MKENKETKEYSFEASLVFVIKDRMVLLAPKEAKIGKNRWNGYGGELEETDASIEACAARELQQECLMLVRQDDLCKVAIAYFTNIKDDGSTFVCKVQVFIVGIEKCIGTPVKTGEMGNPEWFEMGNLPENMMAADHVWLPEIFKGKKIVVRATMKNKQSELVGGVEIIEVDSFE